MGPSDIWSPKNTFNSRRLNLLFVFNLRYVSVGQFNFITASDHSYVPFLHRKTPSMLKKSSELHLEG